MAKIHLDRLQRKYGNTPISGETYEHLIKQIIDVNNENIERGMFRKSKAKWTKAGNKLTKEGVRLVLPSEEDVIPKRALHLRKAAESGQLIRDTLRDRLTGNLRKSLFESETPYIRTRGATAGRINPELITEFEKGIHKTFIDYTRRNKFMNMPANVHNIAVTEVRGAVNGIKKSYADNILENNPDIELEKTWIHNDSLSKEYRKGHKLLNGKTIPYNALFKVRIYKNGKYAGTITMRYPHDPDASAGEVIGCNCDYDIKVKRRIK